MNSEINKLNRNLRQLCTCIRDTSVTCPLHPQIEFEAYPPPAIGMSTGRIGVGIKATHKPSGKFVTVDRHRSQHENKAEAIANLAVLLG